MIEDGYTTGDKQGLPLWTTDQAGPFQTMPYPGSSWCPQEHPVRLPHEYIRAGTAKLLTLFHPATGEVRVKGVTSTDNETLHAWLQQELSAILDSLPPAESGLSVQETHAAWERWHEGLSIKPTFRAVMPPLRMLLVLDNLAGHKTPAFVLWLFDHGIMPLYTPLSGSWLNMTESIQRILKRRALEGHHPTTAEQIIAWLEAAARGWNADPTPFVWGGKRAVRRTRARARHHALGGSGACTRRPLRRRKTPVEKWRSA